MILKLYSTYTVHAYDELGCVHLYIQTKTVIFIQDACNSVDVTKYMCCTSLVHFVCLYVYEITCVYYYHILCSIDSLCCYCKIQGTI